VVRTGIERLLREGSHRSKRLGLVTNPSAVTASGLPTWKALLDSGYDIRAFFGPEHGFRGEAQDAVEVADGEFRGIPSYSLYGARLEPEPRMLEGLDALVYDIQDVGCRYYTYLYTLANVMRACEAASLPVLVLDRPDPLGGIEVEGPPMPDAAASFVGGYRLPPRYGLTVGEFASYLKGEFFPRVELEVVRLELWRRGEYFDASGLPWVNPSPNVPSLDTAIAYPGTCLIEGTWLSEGRGTTRPFETFGAPYVEGPELRDALAALEIPGALFAPASFAPAFSKHQGRSCGGATLFVNDRRAFKPFFAGLSILVALRALYPSDFAWRPLWEDESKFFIDQLAGGAWLREGIEAGVPAKGLYAEACGGEPEYLRVRERYLLYR
jgi:uncharacterized protein YbbC (DUF1343 family)